MINHRIAITVLRQTILRRVREILKQRTCGSFLVLQFLGNCLTVSHSFAHSISGVIVFSFNLMAYNSTMQLITISTSFNSYKINNNKNSCKTCFLHWHLYYSLYMSRLNLRLSWSRLRRHYYHYNHYFKSNSNMFFVNLYFGHSVMGALKSTGPEHVFFSGYRISEDILQY